MPRCRGRAGWSACPTDDPRFRSSRARSLLEQKSIGARPSILRIAAERHQFCGACSSRRERSQTRPLSKRHGFRPDAGHMIEAPMPAGELGPSSPPAKCRRRGGVRRANTEPLAHFRKNRCAIIRRFSPRSTFKRISSDLGGPACVLSAESGYWFRQRCWR